MVGAIKGCTGIEPTIVGKPSPLMIDYIVDKYDVKRCKLVCMTWFKLAIQIKSVQIVACLKRSVCFVHRLVTEAHTNLPRTL